MSTNIQTSQTSDHYPALLNGVRKTLLAGQAAVEHERIKTYWETGKIINQQILKYADRSQYGAELMRRLVTDLGVDKTTLHDCLKFAKIYPSLPIVRRGGQFKWSHYRRLIAISDETKRRRLEENIQRNGWNAQELIARLKEERSVVQPAFADKKLTSRELLKPLCGKLYHYRIVQRPDVSAAGDLRLKVDVGFRSFFNVDARVVAQFREGDIVESFKQDEGYKFRKVEGATASELFTYKAFVERVIDGDTIKVRFDQGFDYEHTDTLRLRGIDCPEMSTKEGVAARNFLMSYVKEASEIIVRSSKNDKYDRYLADVFVQSEEKEVYINNLLLENGHAVRWVA